MVVFVVNVGVVSRTVDPVPVDVVVPVPPDVTGRAVPDKVIARVPEDVIGEPVVVRNDGVVNPTDVTVPVPPVFVHVIGVPTPPPEVKICPIFRFYLLPAVPAVVGRLKLYVPAAACGRIEIVPDDAP